MLRRCRRCSARAFLLPLPWSIDCCCLFAPARFRLLPPLGPLLLLLPPLPLRADSARLRLPLKRLLRRCRASGAARRLFTPGNGAASADFAADCRFADAAVLI